MRFPTDVGDSMYQWGTMEGGSTTSGYYAIRMKSDILSEVEYGGTRTQPGSTVAMVMLRGS